MRLEKDISFGSMVLGSIANAPPMAAPIPGALYRTRVAASAAYK